ncbi:alpha/beta fold hydrolase [Tranquillimonas alkanivorans]|uniref:Haloacetate dehalogenase n=1 Tax=Tranquillimonas alkanivorans TaxID=441119 RepID=A0A1I5PI61_9RHOB|nr:alpha/beta hydrolase [Tranquillimonas alkanivorans]SFP33176.1 haloacetate dehalogenase [Tranquillimonas alkanivorans]
MQTAFQGFETRRIDVGRLSLSVRVGGEGPPLVLLHGFPQTHLCWAQVAPAFAERHTVIVPDLPGYGASDAPADDAEHTVYSKRAMARDVAGLLDSLGHDRASVLGHDRGARVAYRFALDHPDRIDRLGIIEIVPTGDFWAAWNADLALAAYHWTFLAQPAPMPERLIAGDPAGWLDHTLASWSKSGTLNAFPPEALAAYRAQMQDPARIAAMCADYRAGATTDRRLDEADRAAGRTIKAPVRYLYGRHGFPARTGDPAGIWRPWAPVLGTADCDSGHFVPEENPQAVHDAFGPFFAR